MVIRKAISYSLVFMLGLYLGSGGCIDRLLSSDQKKEGIEERVSKAQTKCSLEYNIGVNGYGRRDMQKY